MPDHSRIEFGNERYREGAGSTQRFDDELLGVIADRHRLECGYRHIADGIYIGTRLPLMVIPGVMCLFPSLSMRFLDQGYVSLEPYPLARQNSTPFMLFMVKSGAILSWFDTP